MYCEQSTNLLPAKSRQAPEENEMNPGDDETVATRRTTRWRWHRFKPIRCSVCTGFIWLRPIMLKEPFEAPEPHYEWVLCKPCHKESACRNAPLLITFASAPARCYWSCSCRTFANCVSFARTKGIPARIYLVRAVSDTFRPLSPGHICHSIGGTKIKQIWIILSGCSYYFLPACLISCMIKWIVMSIFNENFLLIPRNPLIFFQKYITV